MDSHCSKDSPSLNEILSRPWAAGSKLAAQERSAVAFRHRLPWRILRPEYKQDGGRLCLLHLQSCHRFYSKQPLKVAYCSSLHIRHISAKMPANRAVLCRRLIWDGAHLSSTRPAILSMAVGRLWGRSFRMDRIPYEGDVGKRRKTKER